jgi:hypothetical protein
VTPPCFNGVDEIVGLIDITVGNRDAPWRIATFHHATLRVAPHRYATREPLGAPGGSRAFSADGHPQAPVAPRRSCAARPFFVAQSWADCIANMPGFNLRQAQRLNAFLKATRALLGHIKRCSHSPRPDDATLAASSSQHRPEYMVPQCRADTIVSGRQSVMPLMMLEQW